LNRGGGTSGPKTEAGRLFFVTSFENNWREATAMRFFGSIWRRTGVRSIILVLIVLFCALIVWFNFFRAKMIGEFFATMQAPPVTVSAAKVEPVTWSPEIDAIGTLSAFQGVDVATQVAGVVKTIDFKANDQIERDQRLVQIDDAVERADLMTGEAALSRDRAALERAKRLRETGVSSEAALDEAQSNLAASESALAKTRAVLDEKSIEAPFSGVIGIPRVDVGQYLQPGGMIATLQQLDTMRADFTVPEQQFGEVTMGQAASFGLTEEEFPYRGRIIGIDPKIDPQTRLVSVRAEVENPDGDLRPGQFVRVRVQLPAMENVIALPQTAVITSLYGDYVYVVESAPATPAGGTPQTPAQPVTGQAPKPAEPQAENSDAALRETLPADKAEGESAPAGDEATQSPPATDQNAAPTAAAPAEGEKLVAKQVFVTIGRRQGDLVEIKKGVEAGQTVVTSGQNKLTNNAAIAINNEVDPAALALDGTDAQPQGGTEAQP
jgi:membrane fusion protein, multidrug efflux system